MFRRQNRKAFTLIELLVAVAIIALLVSIMVPAVQRAREEAKRSACAANLHAIDLAAVLYSESHYEKYPLGWPHDEDPENPGQWTQYGSGAVYNDGRITPQDSFAQMVHYELLVTGSLICPTVGGRPAKDEWELVSAGAPSGTPRWPAAQKFIHYAYQNPGGKYEASPDTAPDWPMFGDRGKRTWTPAIGGLPPLYVLTGQASANHGKKPGCQMIVGGDHAVTREYTETADDPATSYDEKGCCMAGYANGRPHDNIYENNAGNDTWLLDHDGHVFYPPP